MCLFEEVFSLVGCCAAPARNPEYSLLSSLTGLQVNQTSSSEFYISTYRDSPHHPKPDPTQHSSSKLFSGCSGSAKFGKDEEDEKHSAKTYCKMQQFLCNFPQSFLVVVSCKKETHNFLLFCNQSGCFSLTVQLQVTSETESPLGSRCCGPRRET